MRSIDSLSLHLSSLQRIACIALAVGMLLSATEAIAQDKATSLSNLQQKVITAIEKAKPSVVRVIWQHGGERQDSASGVIITSDGYVVTFLYDSYHQVSPHYTPTIPPGQSVTVHLADGRTTSGVAVGTFVAGSKMQFDLLKITQGGTWPAAVMGRKEALSPGETCFCLGYPRERDGSHEPEPSVRIGHLIPWGVPGMLRSSCVVESLGNRGGGLFDLEGRLIGIFLFQGFSDYKARTGPENCCLDSKVVEQNWRGLIQGKTASGSVTGKGTMTENGQDAVLATVPVPDAPELAAAAAKAREASVAIVTFPDEPPFGCSGTIITPDGYIATCAHHHRARGTETTVHFADGRTAPAKILGRDDILDIGLVKITAPGPWPCVPLGKTTDLKAGDPGLVIGYPNHLRKKGEVTIVVRGARIVDMKYAPMEVLYASQLSDGDSGGGLFDTKGRLIGVHCAHATPTIWMADAGADGFSAIWDLLVNGPALSDPVTFDASPAAAALRTAVDSHRNIACEVLGDGKRRALGTVVSSDGFVLTKASELYGDLALRLPDGRTLPATVRNVSRDHDLALLKVEATNLPQITWSERQEVRVGTLVASLRNGEPSTVGVVSYPTRKIAVDQGYLALGKVKDVEGGVEVAELPGWWDKSVSVLSEHPPHPIRVGDVIVSIEGHPISDAKTFDQLFPRRADGTGYDVPLYNAGDPIYVKVRRGGKDMDFHFPLLSTRWNLGSTTSPRSGSFAAVFDTDVCLAKDMCGGPLVDSEGRLVGITIALPLSEVNDSPVMTRVLVIPASVARAVANELK